MLIIFVISLVWWWSIKLFTNEKLNYDVSFIVWFQFLIVSIICDTIMSFITNPILINMMLYFINLVR